MYAKLLFKYNKFQQEFKLMLHNVVFPIEVQILLLLLYYFYYYYTKQYMDMQGLPHKVIG